MHASFGQHLLTWEIGLTAKFADESPDETKRFFICLQTVKK